VFETRDGVSQAHTLADALGLHYAYAAGLGLDLAPESLGNAVLSRWPIVATETRSLPAPIDMNELRVVLRAVIDGPRGPFEVFCTHLNYRLDQSHVRQMPLRAIAEFIAETDAGRGYPPILCGDMNADPRSDEIRMMTGLAAVPVLRQVFVDSWAAAGDGGAGNTWSRKNPFTELDADPRDARIDYVFAGFPMEHAAGEPVACRVVGDQPALGVQPSDHYGVLAELRY
jgi:endonuclease/exonuclease/phosphatase family metal-dependent hydrolase